MFLFYFVETSFFYHLFQIIKKIFVYIFLFFISVYMFFYVFFNFYDSIEIFFNFFFKYNDLIFISIKKTFINALGLAIIPEFKSMFITSLNSDLRIYGLFIFLLFSPKFNVNVYFEFKD
jgi:hypothetical protein